MSEQFQRTQLLIGSAAIEKLKASRVIIFGLGGVGGYVVEAFARGGVGALDLVDSDTLSVSNLNRQILATVSTIGMEKTEAARRRVADIAPDCRVTVHNVFFTPETEGQFDFSQYDYVVDAIDTVTGKLAIVSKAKAAGTPVISCMGTGNKLDPAQFEVTDISKTQICPLARVMRKELRARGINHLKVVYSKEEPIDVGSHEGYAEALAENPGKRQIPGSCSFVPAAAGILLAGEVIKDIIKECCNG